MKHAFAITLAALLCGLPACTEQTASVPTLDQETQDTVNDVKRIMEGDGVTFGDIMGVAKAVGNPDNQKKIACTALSASAGMTALAKQSGVMDDVITEGSLMAHLTRLAEAIAPTLEDTQVSTLAIQSAMKPVYAECLRYSMSVIQGEEAFALGQYVASQ